MDKQRTTVGDGPVYLRVHIDAFDPAFAPGTCTPVGDGLMPHDVISILRSSPDPDIVGMDLVDVAPPFDPVGTTALLGASEVREHLCARASRTGKGRAA